MSSGKEKFSDDNTVLFSLIRNTVMASVHRPIRHWSDTHPDICNVLRTQKNRWLC